MNINISNWLYVNNNFVSFTVSDADNEYLKGRKMNEFITKMKPEKVKALIPGPWYVFKNYSVIYMFPKHPFLQSEIKIHQRNQLCWKCFEDFSDQMLDSCWEINLILHMLWYSNVSFGFILLTVNQFVSDFEFVLKRNKFTHKLFKTCVNVFFS